MSGSTLLISCEHAGDAVPPALVPLFAEQRDLLDSHRGFDRGALDVARMLARAMDAPVFAATITRLVVDLNRSIGHPGLFSAITKALPRSERDHILAEHYHPHRQAVTRAVAAALEAGRTVLHLACHSFTPCLDGVTRHCDVGFLYDPRRLAEKTFCLRWLLALANLEPRYVLRRNYPYRGAADGLATSLRRRFGEGYLGVELEVNQRFALDGGASLARLGEHLAVALTRALDREVRPDAQPS